MKQLTTSVIAMAITMITCAQTVNTSATFSTTTIAITNGGSNGKTSGKSWTITASPFSASSTVRNGGDFTDYLVTNTFDLSSLPASTSISSLSVTITRRANPGTVSDSAVRLRVGTTILYGSATLNANASTGSGATWPTTATATTYTFNNSFLSGLNVSTLKSSGLSVVVAAQNIASGGNPVAEVSGSVSMSIGYLTLAPIILTDFSVARNADNHVDIRFSTSSEDNVKTLYVQRSSNGKDFENIFTLQPKGAANVYTKYSVVDRTPLQGANYYRIAEMDKNGRWYYYITKLINFDGPAQTFNAYYNGGQVVANISNKAGNYEVSLIDMSGITVSRKQVNMTGRSGQLMLDAPSRTGVYVVILKGQGVSESTRVAIVK